MLGKVFWAGALAEMGGRDPREVEQALHELARKELVRPARTSSMEGEREYGFWHVLVRDVCYAQIPRAARAARHRAAAAWLERAGGRAGRRPGRRARPPLPDRARAQPRRRRRRARRRSCEAQAVRYLALAGERALALDVDQAERSSPSALELAPAGHPERASLLERWAQAAQQQGRLQEAQAGARGGARPLPRAGASRRRRPRPDPPRARAPPARRPAERGDARRGARAARGAARRARARRRLRLPGRVPRAHRRATRRRSRPPSGRSRSPPSSACPSRRSRSTAAASPAATWANADGLEDMRRALAARARAGPGTRDRRHLQQPRLGRLAATRGRRRHSTPARRGSTSASGAASPRSRCTCAPRA